MSSTSTSSKTHCPTVLAWIALIACIAAWGVYALVPDWSTVAWATGLATGGLFLLFLVVQLVGE